MISMDFPFLNVRDPRIGNPQMPIRSLFLLRTCKEERILLALVGDRIVLSKPFILLISQGNDSFSFLIRDLGVRRAPTENSPCGPAAHGFACTKESYDVMVLRNVTGVLLVLFLNARWKC